jgi:glycosyltransferase involved in cell wall biosynthesis
LFFGHISYDWVDTQLLRFVAARHPDWHIVLAGRSAVAADEFDQYPNIHLLGERPYEDLPSLCRYASVGIIPFVDSDLTAACNPLKLYEYLAAGLPVVSTDIPEVRRFEETVYIGTSHDSFVSACEKALEVDRSVYSPKASELVREHDWDHRVETIYSFIGA